MCEVGGGSGELTSVSTAMQNASTSKAFELATSAAANCATVIVPKSTIATESTRTFFEQQGLLTPSRASGPVGGEAGSLALFWATLASFLNGRTLSGRVTTGGDEATCTGFVGDPVLPSPRLLTLSAAPRRPRGFGLVAGGILDIRRSMTTNHQRNGQPKIRWGTFNPPVLYRTVILQQHASTHHRAPRANVLNFLHTCAARLIYPPCTRVGCFAGPAAASTNAFISFSLLACAQVWRAHSAHGRQ
jgi:hypothetical protein